MRFMRVVGFIVLAGLVGVATGLVLHRVILGVLISAGILLLGLFALIVRAGSGDPGTGPEGKPGEWRNE
jgi:multisubunit Na+/H+ antiporter MnhC subunit